MTPPPDLVLFGDSITFAWPNPTPGTRIHRGVPGETAIGMVARFGRDVIDLAPRRVQIMAGTNDVAENGGPYDEADTVRAIAAMAARAAGAGVDVLIASVPPAARIWWNPAIDAMARIAALDAALERLARAQGHRFVDYRPALDDGHGAMRAGLSEDGIHPSAAGYAAMEAVLAAIIGADAD